MNSTHTIAVLNRKGGVGKTTGVLNLAAALGVQGRRVLVVDADPQASLTQLILGPNATDRLEPRATLAGLFGRVRPKAASLIVPTDEPNVSLLPGSARLNQEDASAPDQAPRDHQRRIASGLKQLGGSFDSILIDCPPNLGLLSWNSLVAAGSLIVPVTPEDMGVQGIARIKAMIDQVREHANPDLHVLGLLVSLYNPRLKIHRDFDADLRELFGDLMLESRAILATDVKNATNHRQSAIRFRPASRAADCYRAIATEVVGRADALAGQGGNKVAGVAG